MNTVCDDFCGVSMLASSSVKEHAKPGPRRARLPLGRGYAPASPKRTLSSKPPDAKPVARPTTEVTLPPCAARQMERGTAPAIFVHSFPSPLEKTVPSLQPATIVPSRSVVIAEMGAWGAWTTFVAEQPAAPTSR